MSLRDLRTRWLSHRLQRAEDRLADAKHNLRKWGFANTPSENRKAEARIKSLQAHRDALADRKEQTPCRD